MVLEEHEGVQRVQRQGADPQQKLMGRKGVLPPTVLSARIHRSANQVRQACVFPSAAPWAARLYLSSSCHHPTQTIDSRHPCAQSDLAGSSAAAWDSGAATGHAAPGTCGVGFPVAPATQTASTGSPARGARHRGRAPPRRVLRRSGGTRGSAGRHPRSPWPSARHREDIMFTSDRAPAAALMQHTCRQESTARMLRRPGGSARAIEALDAIPPSLQEDQQGVQ